MSAPQAAPGADHNLAGMAQRLEAALRRPPAQRIAEGGATPRGSIASDAKAPPHETKAAVTQPKNSAQPKPQPNPQQSADLEQEMANLLGRPGKT